MACALVLGPLPASAHAGNDDAGLIHACVQKDGGVRILVDTPRLGSPVGADLTSIGGDTAGGAFRFTCNNSTHNVCEVSVAAATLSDVAGEPVYVYPRVLMQKQSYTAPGAQAYCEYGDGSTGASAMLVPTQVSTSTPVYTAMPVNIGGSADCAGPVATAGNVAVITVGPGYYDVFTTFVFKKP